MSTASRDDKPTSTSRRTLLKRAAIAAGGVGAASLPLVWWTRQSTKKPIESIVLVTLDTTRARNLGCYGYGRPTSPNIDRFANEAVVYDRAIAPGTWTLPSHASLFTGKFPSAHGARVDANGPLRMTDLGS